MSKQDDSKSTYGTMRMTAMEGERNYFEKLAADRLSCLAACERETAELRDENARLKDELQKSPCPYCGGSGKNSMFAGVTYPCDKCGGTGRKHDPEDIAF